jgi:hypothetical protein
MYSVCEIVYWQINNVCMYVIPFAIGLLSPKPPTNWLLGGHELTQLSSYKTRYKTSLDSKGLKMLCRMVTFPTERVTATV